MDWNMMDPGGSGTNGLGCFVENLYVPADECEEVLDELIDMLAKEDPKLRIGRRKLSCDRIVEKDLVPLIMCSTDEEIIARSIRLLANLTQPLEVFLQLGGPTEQQFQREINVLVNGAKTRCSDVDFFKSLQNRMEMALIRNGETVLPSDSELLNHALLLLRNLLHTSFEDSETSETAITLQLMLSSFFLSGMDKLVLRMLNHPQKAEWVVSSVQLLSLVFKDHAGVLLEGDAEEEKDNGNSKSECGSESDVPGFMPYHVARLLSHHFKKQLQIGETLRAMGKLTELQPGMETTHLHKACDRTDCRKEFNIARERVEKNMQTDEDDGVESGNNLVRKDVEERMFAPEDSAAGASGESMQEQNGSEGNMYSFKVTNKRLDGLRYTDNGAMSDNDSGRPESRESEERSPLERETMPAGERDSGVEEYPAVLWENLPTLVQKNDKENMSEISSKSCLMDSDLIVGCLRKFATDIVCSGLSSLVQCLMKALMSSYEGVLDESFFMWTVGFFLSFARSTHIEFTQYKELLNLDVFGFLVYQGYRNCETLAYHMKTGGNSSLIKYRLHLIVCTLNQLLQVILTRGKEAVDDRDYLNTLQKCLAQMGDLQRLFILLIRSYEPSFQEVVYLRDLIHTNHTYLLLLEDWVACGYLPQRFTLLSHVEQYASVDVMQKFGSLLEQYTTNNESLNVAILTMMYHIAGDCKHVDVLLQLPILKKFSEIWGDITCTKYVEFNDLIEFTLETFMSMVFKDPVKCAQKLFGLTSQELEVNANSSAESREMGSLTREEEDLLFTWSTEIQGSDSIVDSLVRRFQDQGSSVKRQQVVTYLLQNCCLEEQQMETVSGEIKEESSSSAKKNMISELSSLNADDLLPVLVKKLQNAGFQEQLRWLQEQLLEAAYVRLGVRNSKYRVHVEEPLARFYALQDKSIPLVMALEEDEQMVRDPCFTAFLQALGLFPVDAVVGCVFGHIPHFLTPSQLVRKAEQLGEIDQNMLKFDLTQVKADLSSTEFTPLSKHHCCEDDQEKPQVLDFRPSISSQSHKWLSFVHHFNQSKEPS